MQHCLSSNLLLDAIMLALSTLPLLHSVRSLLNNRIVGWTYGSCKYYNMRMLVTYLMNFEPNKCRVQMPST